MKLTKAGLGDRSCHWKKEALCVYKDTILAGIRFPFHPFIPTLLADVQINSCQLAPNAWRLILCFMVICLKKNFPPSVAIFRNNFQFKNISQTIQGWVFLNQRLNIPHIVNSLSTPDNNLKWKDEYMYLAWEEGNWGTLFRSSFGSVMDGSPNDIVLSPEERVAYDTLIKDNGQTHSWDLLNEMTLREFGLSPVFEKGMPYLTLFSLLFLDCHNYNNFILFSLCLFPVTKLIDEANKPIKLENKRMKRARVAKDPRLGLCLPEFLEESHGEGEAPSSEVSHGRSSVFCPNWGFRGQDSVTRVTKHARDWSLHSITPNDYRDQVIKSELEGTELLGAHALATVIFQLILSF